MPRGVSVYDEARLQQRLWTPLNDPIMPAEFWDASYDASIISDATGIVTWTGRVAGTVGTSPSGTRPAYLRLGRNGTPGINFTNNAYFSFTPPSNFPSGNQIGVIVLSGYLRTTTGTGRWPFVYGAATGTNGTARYVTHTDQYDPSLGIVKAGTGGSGSNVLDTKLWTGNDRFTVSTFGPGQLCSISVDGFPANTGTLSPTLNTSLATGRIGGWNNYGNPWDGIIQSILVYPANVALPQSLLDRLAGWDSWGGGKNGLNLPSSSRFRNRPPLIGD